MQQLHITDPDGDSTGIPFWAGIPTEYQPRMEFLTGITVWVRYIVLIFCYSQEYQTRPCYLGNSSPESRLELELKVQIQVEIRDLNPEVQKCTNEHHIIFSLFISPS